MVARDERDVFPGKMVGAAVADVDDDRQVPAEERGDERRAHAGKILAQLRLLIDRAVGQLQRAAEHGRRLFRRHARLLRAAYLAREDLHGQRARHIAGLRAAHAVADDHEHAVARKRDDGVRILILLADIARVCQSPCLHGGSSFRFFRTFCAAGRRTHRCRCRASGGAWR